MEGLRKVMRIFSPFFNILTCLIIAFDTSFLRVSGSATTDIDLKTATVYGQEHRQICSHSVIYKGNLRRI